MKLYFYSVDTVFEGGKVKRWISCKAIEARETAKLYLPVEKAPGDDYPGAPTFPCGLARLPKQRVDTPEVTEGWLILSAPDDEAARGAWRRHYAKIADMYTRRADECWKKADECRKLSENLA